MRKLVLAAVGATALALSPAANAAVTVVDADTTVEYQTDIIGGGIEFDISYDDAGLTNPFTETLSWENSLAGSYNVSLISAGGVTAFTSVLLTGTGIVGSIAIDSLGPTVFLSNGINLGAGTYTLTIEGNTSGGAAGFGGDVFFSAIPEPGTWAMMLIGFGAVGYAMRRRRRDDLLPQAA